jgi:4'-phosphopantetheinyl transferase N-terminal domain
LSNNTQHPTASFLDSLTILERLFDIPTPEGRCVGLQLMDLEEGHPDSLLPELIVQNSTHWIHSLLHPDEVAYGVQLPSVARRETFFIGRIAVREALGLFQEPMDGSNGIPAILKDDHGRPTMPKGYLGSISHKDKSGVGIVARDESYSSPDDPPHIGIGVDLERCNNSRRNIARRVLTEREISSLGQVEVGWVDFFYWRNAGFFVSIPSNLLPSKLGSCKIRA